MFQPFGWYTAALAGGTEYLGAVPDQTVFTSGSEIRVPPDRNFLLGEIVAFTTNAPSWARLETPSLRPLANQAISQIVANANHEAESYPYQYHFMNPRELRVAESMQINVNETGGTATDVYGVAWCGDGPQQVVTGNMFTTRLTSTIQQVEGEWVAGEMTFTEFLPVTTYQVVGMRTEAADGMVARLIFSNTQIRPGSMVKEDGTNPDDTYFRYGRSGVWGQFDINQPPRLEILGGTAAAQTIFLDLIRTG